MKEFKNVRKFLERIDELNFINKGYNPNNLLLITALFYQKINYLTKLML